MELLDGIGGTVWSLVRTPVSFVVVLTVVVFVHELGHFLVGRWCGIGVTAFSIGFGPEIVGWTDGRGTRWKVAAIPLGGYVKFVGDMNAAGVPDQDALDHMSAAERAISFPNQSLAKRAAVVAAGPIANFIFAVAVYAGTTYALGREILIPRIEAVQPSSAAERAGFQPNDLILSIDGRPVESFSDMQRWVSASAGQALSIVVRRGQDTVTLEATPELKEQSTPFGKQRIGLLGLQASRNPEDQRHLIYGPLESLKLGALETWFLVERTGEAVGKLLTGQESADQLSGPIRIAQVSGQVASISGLSGLIGLVAFLSVSIGLLNLFPIPLLDGGHLLFYAIEAVRGKPLSERAQEVGFRIGFAIIITLMLIATWNDLAQLLAPRITPGT